MTDSMHRSRILQPVDEAASRIDLVWSCDLRWQASKEHSCWPLRVVCPERPREGNLTRSPARGSRRRRSTMVAFFQTPLHPQQPWGSVIENEITRVPNSPFN